MGNAAPFRERHFVGADVETTVDGSRIAIDDFAVEPLREGHRERAFTGCRRPEDRNERLPHDRYCAILHSTYTATSPTTISMPSCCDRVGSGITGRRVIRCRRT